MSNHRELQEPQGDLSLKLGREQVDIENRWEVASILNDVMTGVWFLTGSILNLVGGSGDWPMYFYLAGSSQLLLRALLRLARRIHIRRTSTRSGPRMYKRTTPGSS
ncbi:YrhK family protein [Demequina sp. TMPB413]|uniref:YrhK family protein n=2 Tax=unclassified Demequina TaxID=2620311 RepID=UPI001CF2968F|nr:YrhK family protein [Demequina sp. TMPB413]UPU89250.1 YrhK family protein [Demequina sp. TMPB413]